MARFLPKFPSLLALLPLRARASVFLPSAASIDGRPARRRAGGRGAMGPQQDRSAPPKAYGNGAAAAAAARARRKESKAVRYKECQRNHAASIGGYAVDGCREFMASGAEGTAAALLCAACGCHRSFHRREADAECDCSSDTSGDRR